MDISLNYNGPLVKDKVEQYNKILDELGFDYYWWYKESYEFEGNSSSLCKTVLFRQDAHLLNPHHNEYDYILIFDDDMRVKEGYAKDILAAIMYMDNDSRVGSIVTAGKHNWNYYRYTHKNGAIYPYRDRECGCKTGFGIFLRNIYKDSLFHEEFNGLLGLCEDELVVVSRLAKENMDVRALFTSNVEHAETTDYNGGKDFDWGRNPANMGEGSIYHYMTHNYDIQFDTQRSMMMHFTGKQYGTDYFKNPIEVYDYSKKTFEELWAEYKNNEVKQ